MKIRHCVSAAVLALFLAGCQSTVKSTPVETADAPAAAQQYSRMLVIAGGADQFLKEDSEEAIVAMLQKHGVTGTVGIRVIGPRTKFNRQVIEPYVASGKYDSLLFVRATLADTGEVRPREYGAYEATGNLDDYYDVAMLGYLAGHQVGGGDFNALATLFDVADRKAVWSESYRISNPGNSDKMIGKITRNIEKGLRTAGYLK